MYRIRSGRSSAPWTIDYIVQGLRSSAPCQIDGLRMYRKNRPTCSCRDSKIVLVHHFNHRGAVAHYHYFAIVRSRLFSHKTQLAIGARQCDRNTRLFQSTSPPPGFAYIIQREGCLTCLSQLLANFVGSGKPIQCFSPCFSLQQKVTGHPSRVGGGLQTRALVCCFLAQSFQVGCPLFGI